MTAFTLTLSMLMAFMLSAFHLAARYAQADTGGDAQVNRELGTFAKLAKQLKPAVVNIVVVKAGRQVIIRNFQVSQVPQEGQGSGVIISPDGYVLTNNHVVQGATDLKVTLMDDRELPAKVIGADSGTDLALIKLQSDKPLPYARLGDSSKLEVGDWVMAIGNPFGLEATVTVGVLSGSGRTLGNNLYDEFLQTDAAINPGNSGGPLFNTAGEVVGINTAILSSGQGIGFAIPINLAKDIVAQLQDQGKVVRGFVGIGIAPLTDELRQQLQLDDSLQGALVASVVPGGPADQAGAQKADVVTSINGHKVTSDRDLLTQIAAAKVGSTANLEVMRSGKELTLKVNVAERPQDVQAKQPAPRIRLNR